MEPAGYSGTPLLKEIGKDGDRVDTKICGVDETWSGLRFVIRRRDRK